MGGKISIHMPTIWWPMHWRMFIHLRNLILIHNFYKRERKLFCTIFNIAPRCVQVHGVWPFSYFSLSFRIINKWKNFSSFSSAICIQQHMKKSNKGALNFSKDSIALVQTHNRCSASPAILLLSIFFDNSALSARRIFLTFRHSDVGRARANTFTWSRFSYSR